MLKLFNKCSISAQTVQKTFVTNKKGFKKTELPHKLRRSYQRKKERKIVRVIVANPKLSLIVRFNLILYAEYYKNPELQRAYKNTIID